MIASDQMNIMRQPNVPEHSVDYCRCSMQACYHDHKGVTPKRASLFKSALPAGIGLQLLKASTCEVAHR